MEVPRGLEGSGEDERSTGPDEDRRRSVSLSVRRPADQLRAATGTERRLDAQGDKIMARLVYRKIGDQRIDRRGALGQHDGASGGGVRWYEFRLDKNRDPSALSARHLRAGRLLSLDGQSGDRSRGQHRHRLLVRRHAELRRPAVRGAARRTIRWAS